MLTAFQSCGAGLLKVSQVTEVVSRQKSQRRDQPGQPVRYLLVALNRIEVGWGLLLRPTNSGDEARLLLDPTL